MRKARSLFLPMLLVLALSPQLFGHLTSNLVVDEQGSVYFLDIFGNSLMKVTADGEVSELVDLRALAPEERLHALAMDRDGVLYVCGYYQEKIWKVSPAGEVSPFYPFEGSEPRGSEVLHAGFDASGALYVMHYHYGAAEGAQSYRILRFAGPGEEPAELYVCREGEDGFLDLHNASMLIAGDGTVVLSAAHRIWKVQDDGTLHRVAGSEERGYVDGRGEEARFAWPYGMTLDEDGSILVAELSGRIRRVSADGIVTTVAGTEERSYQDGTLEEARFYQAFGVAVDRKGRLYVAEYAGKEGEREYRVRVVSDGQVRTLARIPSDGVFRK